MRKQLPLPSFGSSMYAHVEMKRRRTLYWMKVTIQSIVTGDVKEIGEIVLEGDDFLASGDGIKLLEEEARLPDGQIFTKEDGEKFLAALVVMYSGVYFRVVPDDFEIALHPLFGVGGD